MQLQTGSECNFPALATQDIVKTTEPHGFQNKNWGVLDMFYSATAVVCFFYIIYKEIVSEWKGRLESLGKTTKLRLIRTCVWTDLPAGSSSMTSPSHQKRGTQSPSRKTCYGATTNWQKNSTRFRNCLETPVLLRMQSLWICYGN